MVRTQIPPSFHITPLQGEDLVQKMRGKPDDDWESIRLLLVTVPWDIDTCYSCWPAELSRYLIPFFGYSSCVETVCHVTVERWMKEKGGGTRWEDIWPFPEYTDCHRRMYADLLLQKGLERVTALRVPFCVFGYEQFVPRILAPHLKKIKKLTFFVVGRVPELLEEYLRELSQEEGLVADLRVLEAEIGYRRLRPECEPQSVILDFSGEERLVPAAGTAGIIWIDLDSSEIKKQKIITKSVETAYFSMKEEWGRLDTVGKNRYNT